MLLRRKLVQDGKGCSGMVLKTQEWCRQVGIGQTGVGTVTVMTECMNECHVPTSGLYHICIE